MLAQATTDDFTAGARWPRIALSATGALLLADAIALMLTGLINFGVALPAAIGAAFLVLSWRWHAVAQWRAASTRHQRLWRAGWTIFFAWLATVVVFFHTINREIAESAPGNAAAKAIVILGSGSPHCTASPTLAARLDEGMTLARRMASARVVVSGGVGFNEQCSEADVMADYLIARGMTPGRLIREDRSTSTDENMRFSRQLLEHDGVSAAEPIVVVTSDFHLMRATRIARKAGFATVYEAGAATPLYVRYNAWLREYFANISGWVLGEY